MKAKGTGMKQNSTTAQRPAFLHVITAMLRLAIQVHPVMTLVYVLTSLAFTGLLIANLHLTSVLLNRLPLFAEGQISFISVLQAILLLGGMNIFCTLMNAGMNISFEYVTSLASAKMTKAMGSKVGRLELIRFESAELYDGIERATAGINRGFEAMEAVIATIVFHGGYFIFLAFYLVPLEPVLVLGVFAAFLPVAFSRAIRASAFYHTEYKVSPLRRVFNHYEACLTDRTYFKETRTTGAAPFFRRKYDQTLNDYNRELWRTELRTGMIDIALKLLTLGGYVGLLLLLIRFVIMGRISPGLFGAVYFAMDSIFKWFDELFDRVGFAYENAAFGGNYLAFLEMPERKRGSAPLPRDRGVELQAVRFTYPGASESAVDSVSLSIKPGEAVAIVGENGAGKSTLVRLIAGLYRPQSGSVRIGGTDLRDAADETRFHHLSAVFQQYQRYRMTLLDNVRIAEPSLHERSDQEGSERSRAADSLNTAGFFHLNNAQVEKNLDGMLSREFGGVDLSGGEWQRVAIARGLYRLHDTIILDEPTAAIDPIEEDRVYRMFLQSAQGKTAIIVTHRLGLARIADRILVMKRGRIVQDGSHAELMAVDGPYARMFQSQAAWYQR
jgi:ATP-binding cassette, subfamily B, bacterial